MLNNIDYKEIGRRIELRRKELDMTLAELASVVDLSASTIQRYEKGLFDKIKMPIIEAVAAALHVSPEWLIGNTDDPVDYADSDLIATIPLSYLKACSGDVKRAFQMMKAVNKDCDLEHSPTPLQARDCDFARNQQEKEMLLLARHIAPIPDEQRKKLIDALKTSADFYLEAMGITKGDTEDHET